MDSDEITESIQTNGRNAIDRLQDGLNTARDRVQDGISIAKDRVQDGINVTRERVQDGLNATRERVQESLHTARDKSNDAVQTGIRYVRANPVPVIAGALVVGVVLGYLFMRRSEEETLRTRLGVDDRLDGVSGWLKDRLTPVAEAAQRHVRTAGEALEDARQRVSELDVKQYIDPLVGKTRKASSRFNFWQ